MAFRYRRDLRDTAGNPAYAATWIRTRVIFLDADLRQDPGERHRVVLHELFHFVWVRLGNPRRFAWESVLAAERKARARGEAGWSAEWRKGELSDRDAAERSRRWREYCCESFCDTAAIAAGANRREATLASGRLRDRLNWFRRQFGAETFPI